MVAHIDIDPAEISKNVPTQIPIVGTAKLALEALLEKSGSKTNHMEWLVFTAKSKRKKYPFAYKETDEAIKPQAAIAALHEITGGNAIITTDVGQHQMWSAQYYPFKKTLTNG
ncbi:hypothetical protein GCM10020331_069300 [Ectobacillus funiculus]